MSDLVSIILPVYNGESVIENILTSIKNQIYKKWELIIVDDGSIDDTRSKCQAIIKPTDNINYYFKENGGVSSARNFGLDKAQGDWVVFIDADDNISDKYLLDLVSNVNPKELIIQGYKKIEKNKITDIDFGNFSNISEKKSLFDEFNILEKGFPWNKIFDNQIIRKHNLRFNENLSYAEDLVFLLKYLVYVERVSFISGSNYIYDTTNSSNSQKIYSYNQELELLQQLTSTIPLVYKNNFSAYINTKISLVIIRVILAIYQDNVFSFKERMTLLKNLKKNYNCIFPKYYNPQILFFKLIKILFKYNLTLMDSFLLLKYVNK